MTLQTTAWGHDDGTYSGKDMRQLVEAMFAGQTGVAMAGDLLVEQQSVAASTVKVAAGHVIVDATGAGLYGNYHVWNDASINSPAFAPTSTNGRKDRLILRVTGGVPALEIVQGVASGSPAEPAITGDNYEELALITLPGSTANITTAMITDRRKRAAATAGKIVCTSTTRPSAPFEGMEIYETDTKNTLIYSTVGWVCITPQSSTVATAQAAGSFGAYVNLATVGPTVSLATGTKARVTITSGCNSTGNVTVNVGVAVSGATTLAASDTNATSLHNITALNNILVARTFTVTGLTPGVNTFTLKYKASAGTTNFLNRDLTVTGVV